MPGNILFFPFKIMDYKLKLSKNLQSNRFSEIYMYMHACMFIRSDVSKITLKGSGRITGLTLSTWET